MSRVSKKTCGKTVSMAFRRVLRPSWRPVSGWSRAAKGERMRAKVTSVRCIKKSMMSRTVEMRWITSMTATLM